MENPRVTRDGVNGDGIPIFKVTIYTSPTEKRRGQAAAHMRNHAREVGLGATAYLSHTDYDDWSVYRYTMVVRPDVHMVPLSPDELDMLINATQEAYDRRNESPDMDTYEQSLSLGVLLARLKRQLAGEE